MWTVLIKDVSFYDTAGQLVVFSKGNYVFVDLAYGVGLVEDYHFDIYADEFLYYH